MRSPGPDDPDGDERHPSSPRLTDRVRQRQRASGLHAGKPHALHDQSCPVLSSPALLAEFLVLSSCRVTVYSFRRR